MAIAAFIIVVVVIGHAVACVVYSRRRAAIESRRLHDALTPELAITCDARPGADSRRVDMTLKLIGPAGLDRLDEVTVCIRDDIPDRKSTLGSQLTQGQISEVIWGPYRLDPGVPGTESYGRAHGPFRLPKHELYRIQLEQTMTPAWTVPSFWKKRYGGMPVRLELTCRRKGHEPWILQREVLGPENPAWSPRQYLFDLNKTAIYAVTRGMPILLVTHATFLVAFIAAWLTKQPDSAREAARALFDRWPQWSQRRIEGWLKSPRLPNELLLLLLLTPLLLELLGVGPWQIERSAINGIWDVFRKGVRGVPPLITAVVVVFVTSDAWRILGTGFTVRFAVLVFLFLAASLLFLIRWTCWDDIDAKPHEGAVLLKGIKHKRSVGFHEFIDRGVEPAPMVRPRKLGAIWVYTGYWLLCALTLVVTALFVSVTLIIIGVILINKSETMTLANSVYVYHTFPGGVVITKQLVSLSFSLGAFAAFFLVAAQRPSDRKAFMNNVLVRYRQVLLVYSIYCRAHDRASEWTKVPVDVRPLDLMPLNLS